MNPPAGYDNKRRDAIMKKSRKQLVKTHLLIAGAMGFCVAFLYITGIGCPFRRVTDIPCPGCGLTRAWVECFHLDFLKAFQYHPLFLLAPPLLFLGIHRGTRIFSKIPIRVQDGILIGGGFLFLIVYIIRFFIT